MEKIPYMLVIGDKEAADKAVAVRSRTEGDIGILPLADFIGKIAAEIERRQ